ncbi:type II secretion system F family protein [Candidatus Bathyarchaeota archaeon]|nr:type II secretion system F family protein [Candidatus Bathyarchaeota archaeon]
MSLRVAHVLPRGVLSKFSGLRLKLAKASIKTGFEVYVGLVLFVCVVSGIVAFAFSLFLLSQLGFALLTGVLLSLLVGGAVGLFSVGIGYLYPVLSAYSRGNKIDANLPFIAHFMAVLASSGMTPESVFRSLARVGKEYSVRKEVMGLIGEIELLGADLHTSLKRVSEVSPSRKFGNLLNGIITTSHMGGDLAEYLNQEAKRFKELRMGKNKRFLENLGVIAEVYVVFLVAAPLMLIIMLSVMSYIGGPLSLGTLNPNELLNLLTFVLIPIGIFFLILMVDYITPLR